MDEENPFASPRSSPGTLATGRTVSAGVIILALLLSLPAGGIAFCCSCFPSALVLWQGDGPDILFVVPWIIGLVVGVAAGIGTYRLIIHLGRRTR